MYRLKHIAIAAAVYAATLAFIYKGKWSDPSNRPRQGTPAQRQNLANWTREAQQKGVHPAVASQVIQQALLVTNPNVLHTA